jgi:hypothetical protein
MINESFYTQLFQNYIRVSGNSHSPKNKDMVMLTAYHEAGHAVRLLYDDFTPLMATVVEDEDSLGRVMPPWFGEDFSNYLAFEREDCEEWNSIREFYFLAEYALSGTIAASHYNNMLGIIAKSDFLDIAEFAFAYKINLNEQTITTIVQNTINIIDANKKLLQVIAMDLYKHKTLNQEYFIKLAEQFKDKS